eukprot:gene13135-3458_t
MEREELCKKHVGNGADGASVNRGEFNGIVARLRRTYSPKLQNNHCAAHRGSLACAALQICILLQSLESTIKHVSAYFGHSTKRVRALARAAVLMEHRYLKAIKLIVTRWLCIYHAMNRLDIIYDELVLVCYKDPDASLLYHQLVNVEFVLGIQGVLPLLRELNTFIKLCQLRGVFVMDLLASLKRAERRIREMYINPSTKYSSVSNPAMVPFNTLIKGPEDDSSSRLFWDEQELLKVRLADGLTHQMEGLPRYTGPGRPHNRPQDVTKVMFDTSVKYVKTQLTKAAGDLLVELRHRFPEEAMLQAWAIVYPQFWKEKPNMERFKTLLQRLTDVYCVTDEMSGGSTSPPLLSLEMLDRQTDYFFKEALALAAPLKSAIANPAAETVSDDDDSSDDGEGGEEIAEDAEAAVEDDDTVDPDETRTFWRELCRGGELSRGAMSEFIKLAQLILVQVPGSWLPIFSLLGTTTKGRDHIWLTSVDEGACYMPSEIYNTSIVFTHWGRLGPDNYSSAEESLWLDADPDDWTQSYKGHACFDPEKDLAIPAFMVPPHYKHSPLLGAAPKERDILLYFRGDVGKARAPWLAEKNDWKTKHSIWVGDWDDINGMFLVAPFCNSLYQTVFESIMDWSRFSIRINETDIERTPQILEAISDSQIIRMQRHLSTVWTR